MPARRSLLRAALVVLPSVLAAVALPRALPAQSGVRLAQPPGPHGVGFRYVGLLDRSRNVPRDTLDAAGRPVVAFRPRPIPVGIWYPARVPANAPRMRYRDYAALTQPAPYRLPDPTTPGGREAGVQALLRAENLLLFTPGPGAFRARQAALDTAVRRELDVPVGAVRDAAPATGRFPVVVYAPGALGPLYENEVLAEHLASHGYLVAALPHTIPSQDVTAPAGIEAYARDLEHVLAYARSLPNADSTRVAVSGFSIGGLASTLVAARNRSISAVVGLDASVRYMYDQWWLPAFRASVPAPLDAAYTTPTLFLNQGATTSAGVRAMGADTTFRFVEEACHAPLQVVTLKTIKHQNMASWYNRLAGPQREGFVADRAVAGAGYERVVLLARTFLDAQLKGDAAARALLAREPNEWSMPAAEVSVVRKTPISVLPTLASFRAVLGDRGPLAAPALVDEALKTCPTFAMAERPWTQWGWELMNERPVEAVAVMQARARLFPQSLGAINDLGDAYRAAHDTANAIRSFERVLRADSTNRYAREMLGKMRQP